MFRRAHSGCYMSIMERYFNQVVLVAMFTNEPSLVLNHLHTTNLVILCMDKILHHLTSPGFMIPLYCKYQANGGSPWFQSGANCTS